MSDLTSRPLWNDLLVAVDKPADGDFVHRLTSVVDDAKSTVNNWVLTPGLRDALDQAATLVRSAAYGGRSRACMLRGGFGSGKSHFMAVLSLLLERHAALLNDDRFAYFHEKYGEFGGSVRFLTVQLHMLDAQSTESAVFSGYLQTIERLHPDKAPPDLMALGPVVAMGQQLRANVGDTVFLDTLHGRKFGGPGALGAILNSAGVTTNAQWTVESLNDAFASPGSKGWTALGKQLMQTVFSGVQARAQAGARPNDDAWLAFDDGLALMCEHAKQLGYQGIVLFLDEHMLWLSGMASTPERLQREIEKLPKLVESGSRARPVPIVAFLAQQFDLDHYAATRGDARGAELRNLAQHLSHHRGRFEDIHLPTNGLPLIVEQRLLRTNPAAPGAADRIDAAWNDFYRKLPERHRKTLSMGMASETDMRRIWPFSNVLMEALEHLSDKLQRDRTALKLLTLLRWRYREQLRLGDILPMGDLWPELDSGQDPVDEVSKAIFQRARRFYHNRALPWLQLQHRLSAEDLRPGVEHPPETRTRLAAFRRDHLILCTLLVTALLPDWEVTRALDVDRLYALNYGAVGGRMVTGIETGGLLRILRELANEFEEIVLGTEPADNPSVSLRLTGIELDPLLRAARGHISESRLLATLRDLLLKDLPFASRSQSSIRYAWNATECHTRLDFGNARAVRDDSHWQTSADETCIFVDYPFDLRGYGSNDDHTRLNEWEQLHPEGANTLVWLPRHLSESGRELLEKYAAMEYAEQEFNSLTSSYAVNDREPLRELLRLQLSQKVNVVRAMLLAAYGLAQGDSQQYLRDDEKYLSPLRSLRHEFAPQMPAVVTFAEAMVDLGRQLQRHLHAQAPPGLRHEPLKNQEANQLTAFLVKAFSEREPSVALSGEKSLVPLLSEVAVPLGLGQLVEGNSRFRVNESAGAELSRTLDATTSGACTVDELRRAANQHQGQSRGLPAGLIELLVRCWVLRNDIVLYDGTLPLEDIDQSREYQASWIARRFALPEESVWAQALDHAQKLLNFDSRDYPYRTVRSLHRLRDEVRKWVDANSWLPDLLRHLEDLGTLAGLLAPGVEVPRRIQHVRELYEIHARLNRVKSDSMAVVEVLGGRPSLVIDALKGTLLRGKGLGDIWQDTRMGTVNVLREAIKNGSATPEDKQVVQAFDDLVFHVSISHLQLDQVLQQLEAAKLRVYARSAAPASATAPVAAPTPEPDPTAALHRDVHTALHPEEQPAPPRILVRTNESPTSTEPGGTSQQPATSNATATRVPRGKRHVSTTDELDALWSELRVQLALGRAVVLQWHDADESVATSEEGES